MPPTIAYPLVTLASLLLLALVGVGPSLYLVSRLNTRRVETAILISPAVALAEIGIIFYPLFRGSIPVDRYDVPMAVLLVGVSVALSMLDFRRRRADYARLFATANLKYLAAFALVFLLLVLPAFVGGDRARYWERNPYDATNYWGLTYFAQHIPFNQITTDPQAIQDAVERNPILITVIQGGPIFTRPVVELPFAWLSLLFRIPVYEFYHYFKLLAFSVAFLGGLALARGLKLPRSFGFSLAAVLVLGFWAWIVSYLDALSNVYSVPLGVLFVFAWLQLEEDAPLKLFSRQRLLFSLSLAALLGYYPESMPFALLAVALYYAKLWLDLLRRGNLRRLLGLLVSVGLVVVFVLPTLDIMLHDLLRQSGEASLEITNTGAISFFGWIISREMLGAPLWGLVLYRDGLGLNVLALTGLAVVLGVITLTGIVRNLFGRRTPLRLTMVAALVTSFWGGALGIFLLRQEWVAGKVFVIGAPFAIIALCVFTHQIISTPTIRKFARTIVAASFAIWCVSQFLIPPVRALYPSTDKVNSGYGNLEEQSGDIVPAMNTLRQNPPELLVSYFPETPVVAGTGWQMMLSDQLRHVVLEGLPRRYDRELIAAWQQFDDVPSHILFDKPVNYFEATSVGTLVPIENTSFRLYSVAPDELNRAVYRSDFMVPDRQQGFASAFLPFAVSEPEPTRLLTREQGRIRFLGGTSTPISLRLRYQADADGTISLVFNGSPLQETVIQAGVVSVISQCVIMKTGTNDLLINHQSAGDLATTPLKITQFQVASASGTEVDVGSAGDGLSDVEGWYGRETVDANLNFRWVAKIASLAFQTCETSDYTLRFRAFPFAADEPQTVTIAVNGDVVDTLLMGEGLQEYEVSIPADFLNADGLQTVQFEHEYVEIPPNDTRALAAFYDWIALQTDSP